MANRFLIVSILISNLFVMGAFALHARETTGGKTMKLTVTSPAFSEGGPIPSKYTCDGPDFSPPLEIRHIPDGTKSLALISDDPDAPRGTWVHWVLYDWPPTQPDLPENLPKTGELSNGAKQGTNDFRRLGYGGPCPPSGTHRYFFKVYALDTVLGKPSGLTKAQLEAAMKGHILAEGVLMGRYARK
ncbi:MAG: YbhB/YbcL family Raf kinase inhibitor-like protein [Candidatus Sumerlaeaceae bacterium]|nr:YbhB/YbcL family Raf kinase inhibitor-like protein [Candidatus Sumerlaeaceae bacterium]